MPTVGAARFQRRVGHPKGAAWTIADDVALAEIAAQLALGQWENVVEILRGSGWAEPPAGYAVNGARKLFTVEPGKDPWHRDGWLFQLVSWIAAVEGGKGPVRPPHMIHAHKGVDGLQLLLSSDQSRLKRLIIFEDKATTDPRTTIRDEVWPGFRSLESGDRDQELLSELSSLLLHAPHLDKVAAIDRAIRQKKHRSYRVAITVGETHSSDAGIKRLFAGYKEVVKGRRYRRRAHILHSDDVRAWLARISDYAMEYLDEVEKTASGPEEMTVV